MESNIQNFFSDKVVFITGGTGFLGKAFLEKLLRTTKVKMIYIMIRPKAEQDIEERFEKSILKCCLFEQLRLQRPEFNKSFKLIKGDCCLPDLGLSTSDRQELIENVNVIVHCAATIRFNEPLSRAAEINVGATMDLINIAKEMEKLKVFVHVSTAFVNCIEPHSKEIFYHKNLSTTSQQLLELKDNMGKENLDKLTEQLMGRYPNCYCLTKAIGEEALKSYGSTLPICILRPGIIVPIYGEPMPGWTEGLQGAVGAQYCASMGALRILNANTEVNAALVPVDFCVNIMMAAAWYTATLDKEGPSRKLLICNMVPEESNTIQWAPYWNTARSYVCQAPYTNSIWLPMLIFIETKLFYYLAVLFYQTLPAYVMDACLLMRGKKARMVKVNRKVTELVYLLRHFLMNNFTFDTSNTRALWKSMSLNDQTMYNFDMSTLKWDEYISRIANGLRLYVAKENPETISHAKKLWRRYFYLNLMVHCLVIGGLLWIFLKLFDIL